MCKTSKRNLTSSKVFSRRRRRRSPSHMRHPLPITVAIQGNPMRRTLEGAIVWSMAWTLFRFLRGTLMLLEACKSWMNPSYSTALRKITRSRCTHLPNSHTMWSFWKPQPSIRFSHFVPHKNLQANQILNHKTGQINSWLSSNKSLLKKFHRRFLWSCKRRSTRSGEMRTKESKTTRAAGSSRMNSRGST
jgi:hypothetical protein